MGTVFSFDVRGAGPRAAAAFEAAVAWLHHVDEVFSTYRPESQISRLAAGKLALSGCSPEVWEVLRLCEAAERRSGGWFSAGYAGGFDPTGLVKGWAVERAAAMISSAGAEAVCVNGGGDVQVHGGPWRIGVSDPVRRGGLATVVHADGELAVATSGPAERGCHIVDPGTGRPPAAGLASLTVLCRGLTDADAYATAGYAMGDRARAWLESLPGTRSLAIDTDGNSWTTGGTGPDSGPACR
ncbi:FAD:protein FMN transferase [Streptomyces sp. NPDC049040]|uniref:FAD:protein FMN transferase n=1 Tax=Streptomyces sp. NPDC049040 TaxID=3365593 RepID=UPI00371FA2D0